MSIMNYWPSLENIEQCIRNEAEELQDDVLLAVHEPMVLIRRDVNNNQAALSDEDLFTQLLTTERAIPLIGRSGMGKSHLVRWLDCRLKSHLHAKGELAQWEIVRIPKNASLRQVLLLILKNLHGGIFDDARKRVDDVAEQHSAKDLADLMLTMMSHQLESMYNEAMAIGQEYESQGKEIPADLLNRLEAIIEEVENGIGNLITDPNFKLNLLKPDHCIYKRASRMSDGLKEDDEDHDNYELAPADLFFQDNIDDLSSLAREYISHSRIDEHDNEKARIQAVRVLNEAMHAALKSLFSKLFTFNGGNFQELFQQIRRELLAQERRLVILVEDMAAISAIEDVLIDSLIEEGMRDGVKTLCPVHSVIAVTDNYPGYKRRQETLMTRAGYEWIIESIDRDNNEGRIVSLCGRYLNAARHGAATLKQLRAQGLADWPPVWNDDAASEWLTDFGMTDKQQVPLFPFNRNAILALANKNCRDSSGQLAFNPRIVINRILLDILRDCRVEAERGTFPPPNLAGITTDAEIQNKINQLTTSRAASAASLAALWGYGSHSWDEVSQQLPSGVAKAFGLNELAERLNGKPYENSNGKEKPDQIKIIDPKPLINPKPPEEKPGLPFIKHLKSWVNDKAILPQDIARDLRAGLNNCYELYAQAEFFGMVDKPSLVERIPLISLPLSASDPSNAIVKFYDRKDLDDPLRRIEIYNVALAVLRIQHYTNNGEGLSYPEALEDYAHYENFVSWWVPQATEIGVNHARARKLKPALRNHYQKALLLGLLTGKENPAELVDALCLTQKGVGRTEGKGRGRTPDTNPSDLCFYGLEANQKPYASIKVAEARQTALQDWDEARNTWLSLVAITELKFGLPSTRALEAEVVTFALKEIQKEPLGAEIQRAAETARKEIAPTIENAQLFENIKNQDDFIALLDDWQTFIEAVRTQYYPPESEQIRNSSWLMGEIEALKVDAEASLNTLQTLNSLAKQKDAFMLWHDISHLDGDYISRIGNLLAQWQNIQSKISFTLQQINSKGDAPKLDNARKQVEERLKNLAANISASGVNA
ncbi:protein DpdH [Enterobacter sp.]|uniref:protein DpdH n=1 Tax=Enterobacter sp. TaxID=42895 RepID=UPI00296EA454|nr:protein DpdH [Enterobacter sp.]